MERNAPVSDDLSINSDFTIRCDMKWYGGWTMPAQSVGIRQQKWCVPLALHAPCGTLGRAARPGRWERPLLGFVVVLRFFQQDAELFAEFIAGSVDATANCADRAPNRFGGIFVRHAFNFGQYNCLPKFFG